jgi:DNA topoisomerase-3
MDANENYGMYGSDVNKALESLFLKKIITYPRTDSRYITTDMKDKVKRVIENLPPRYDDIKSMIVENKIDFHNDRVFNDEKVHGHPAIIPTEVKHNFEKLQSLSDNEIKIYGLIVRSFLKCFMTNTVFESYCVEGIDDKSKKYTLKLKKIIEPGFRYANKGYGSNLHDDSKNEIEIKTINHLSPDDEFIIQRVKLKKGETVPAKHYTDATIMLLMENASRLIADEELRKKYKNQKLGTPATRTQIIERLIKLGYVRRINKNDIVATELGYNVIDNIKLEDLKQADMTAAWEYKLNQIENNEFSKDEFIKEIKDYTTEKCDILKKEIDNIDPEEILGFCPDCGGKVYKNKFGSYNCENVLKKTCLFKITDNLKGKPIYDDIVKEILAAGKTKKLRGFISTKNNSKYPYSAYLILKKVDDRTYVNVSFEEP